MLSQLCSVYFWNISCNGQVHSPRMAKKNKTTKANTKKKQNVLPVNILLNFANRMPSTPKLSRQHLKNVRYVKWLGIYLTWSHDWRYMAMCKAEEVGQGHVHKVSNCRVGQMKLTIDLLWWTEAVPSLIPEWISCNKGTDLEMHAQECN